MSFRFGPNNTQRADAAKRKLIQRGLGGQFSGAYISDFEIPYTKGLNNRPDVKVVNDVHLSLGKIKQATKTPIK
jgi:hypothetical protein